MGGFTAFEVKQAGFTAKQVKEGQFECRNMVDAEFRPLDLRRAGWSAKELRNGGLGPGVLKRCGFSLTELKQAEFSNAACHHSAQAMRGMIDTVPHYDDRRFHRAPKMPDNFTPRIRFFTDADQKVSKGLVAREKFMAAGLRIGMMNAQKRGSLNIAAVVNAAKAANNAEKAAEAMREQEEKSQQRSQSMFSAVKEVTTSVGAPKEVKI